MWLRPGDKTVGGGGTTAAAILNICPVFYTISLSPFLEAEEELELYCLLLGSYFSSEIHGVTLKIIPGPLALPPNPLFSLSPAVPLYRKAVCLSLASFSICSSWFHNLMCSPRISLYSLDVLPTSFKHVILPLYQLLASCFFQPEHLPNLISVLATASSLKPHGRLVFPQRPSLPVSSPNSLSSLWTILSCDSLVKMVAALLLDDLPQRTKSPSGILSSQPHLLGILTASIDLNSHLAFDTYLLD